MELFDQYFNIADILQIINLIKDTQESSIKYK